MDNCKSCLDNPHLAKHLIIAIGIKVPQNIHSAVVIKKRFKVHEH